MIFKNPFVYQHPSPELSIHSHGLTQFHTAEELCWVPMKEKKKDLRERSESFHTTWK
jgi:hypothetical protein